ncbi:HTH domain-containing protein [Fusibacter bizertensis]
MENYDVVLDYFKKLKEPVSAGTIAEETGVDRKSVDKIMKKLKEDEVIVSPKRCYWEYKK